MAADVGVPGATETAPPTAQFMHHCAALHSKNITVALRNRRATLMQLFASFFFMLFVYIVDVAVQTQQKEESRFRNLPNPERVDVAPIPLCEVIHDTCYTFAYSPQNDADVEAIVRAIRENNDPPIPAASVMSFSSGLAADDYMLANPETVQGAVHFAKVSPTRIHFEIQFNASTIYSRGKFGDPNMLVSMPLQVATEREIVRHELGEPNLEWDAGFREFAHPAFRTQSIVSSVGPPFFFAGAMFGFVIQVGAVVLEREQKQRQAMEGMGMSRPAWWLTWLTFELIMVTASAVLLCLFGVILQFDLFLKNDISLTFMLIFLFMLAMCGLAFLISTLTSKSASATSVGFVVFLFGFVFQIVVQFGFPFSTDFERYWQILFAFFPPTLFSKGLIDLGRYSTNDGDGLSWSDRNDYCVEADGCVFSLGTIYWWYVMCFVLYMTGALYLDRVIPDDGLVLPPWFCFKPSFWLSADPEMVESTEDAFGTPTDEDVQSEAERVKQRSGGPMDEAAAVEVRGLVKTFKSRLYLPGGDEFTAVKGPWFEIKKNELFCLLGPNGAGKTTTINMLVGNLPPTAGQALEYGHAVSSPAGMRAIRKIIGVCPQFDVQWGQLTAYEHLKLFGTLKGIAADKLDEEIKTRLSQVGLGYKEPWLCGDDAEKAKAPNKVGSRVATFSGGEKRRLSVAMALMGEPKIIYLDEPTTGMDPISRREVWNLINAAKDNVRYPGRAVILTTHSMEEAEILGDRVSIICKGVMRCIGTSIRLKQRFGAGFTVTVAPTTADGAAAVTAAFERIDVHEDTGASGGGGAVSQSTNQIADGGVEQEVGSIALQRYVIARAKEAELVDVFAQLKEVAGAGELTLSLTTLEAVFLRIAKEAEIAEGNGKVQEIEVESELLKNSSQKVNVAIGSDTQLVRLQSADGSWESYLLKVEWGQDEDGNFDALETTVRAATAEEQAAANGGGAAP
jgi:ABC-type multidrug transport system ATPase subunit